MRRLSLLCLILALSACDVLDSGDSRTVTQAPTGSISARERALMFAADGAAQQGNIDAAERDYLAAAALSTGPVDAHLALARLYEKHLQSDKERAILEEALALQPDHPLANYWMGKLQLDAHAYEEALASFGRGLKTKPDDMDLNSGTAIAHDMLGNHSEAQALYLRTMAINPRANLTNLRTNLAMSYLLSNQPQKAVELLQPDVQKAGVSSVTRHNLALAYGVLGRHAEAKKLLAGDMDEETRLLAIARLKQYIREHAEDGIPPITPSIMTPEAEENPQPEKASKAKAITSSPKKSEEVEIDHNLDH